MLTGGGCQQDTPRNSDGDESYRFPLRKSPASTMSYRAARYDTRTLSHGAQAARHDTQTATAAMMARASSQQQLYPWQSLNARMWQVSSSNRDRSRDSGNDRSGDSDGIDFEAPAYTNAVTKAQIPTKATQSSARTRCRYRDSRGARRGDGGDSARRLSSRTICDYQDDSNFDNDNGVGYSRVDGYSKSRRSLESAATATVGVRSAWTMRATQAWCRRTTRTCDGQWHHIACAPVLVRATAVTES